MIINATLIRVGMILVLDKELYRVTWKMHRTPGKGVACMQTKLKNILDGRNLEKRFTSNERVERAALDTREMQYLYKDSEGFIFMDSETFEQSPISVELIGEAQKFLKEGEAYKITFYQENPVGLDLPLTIVLEVTEAPPEIRKATASSSLRPVTLENGMVVQAPAFIKTGDKIKVNTETNEYLERTKS